MVDIAAFTQALAIVLQIDTLLWLCIGVAVGIGVGAMPGLQATTAIALMLPLTFSMSLGPALGLLIGLYKGATYGGSISAITFSTPGTPDSAATVFDGYKLMQRGQGRKAMLMALYASVTADLMSDILTILIAPALAIVALKFGPAERFWVMVLAITLVGSLAGSHVVKGLFSAAIGLFIGTIGTDPIAYVPRNTFNQWWLGDGIPFPAMLIGVFAMSMVIGELMISRTAAKISISSKKLMQSLSNNSDTLTWREFIQCRKEIGIGFGIGSFVGMLPGLGGTAGAFLAYAAARFASPQKNIGSGRLEGVAAAEAGNNATVGPTLVPLLVLGVPGSAAAALIGGALVLQGVTPSPRMFELFPDVIYALFIILIIGNFVNLGFGRAFSFVFAKLGAIPKQILVPLIGIMATVGIYVYEHNPYHVGIMFAFGVLGYLFKITRVPEAPMVITFLLAPLAEENLRRAQLIGGGDLTETLFNSPVSIGISIAAAGSIWFATRIQIYERIDRIRANSQSDASVGNAIQVDGDIAYTVNKDGDNQNGAASTEKDTRSSGQRPIGQRIWLASGLIALTAAIVTTAVLSYKVKNNLPANSSVIAVTNTPPTMSLSATARTDDAIVTSDDTNPVRQVAPTISPDQFANRYNQAPQSGKALLVKTSVTNAEIEMQAVIPNPDKAWHLIQTVLLVEPENIAARSTMQRILSHYVELASIAKTNGDDSQADIYTRKAHAIVFGTDIW